MALSPELQHSFSIIGYFLTIIDQFQIEKYSIKNVKFNGKKIHARLCCKFNVIFQ